jgi:hypothetical protein
VGVVFGCRGGNCTLTAQIGGSFQVGAGAGGVGTECTVCWRSPLASSGRARPRGSSASWSHRKALPAWSYVDPPAHAVVLSVDEKSQIQALDRTQPGLPLKKGRCGTMTHDYVRNGATTLFAAFDVLEGKIIGRCMQRHRHQEFIRFLNAIGAEVPAGKVVHVILDNYAAHSSAASGGSCPGIGLLRRRWWYARPC